MKIKSLGKNQTEITTARAIVFVSYETPVAALLEDPVTKQFIGFKTDKKWSVTTSRHINQWFYDLGPAGIDIHVKPQAWFDGLLEDSNPDPHQ